MEDGIVFSMWRNFDLDWSAQNSVGNSGGILTMWNTVRISACFSFSGKGFLVLNFVWNNHRLMVINVYVPCGSADKRKLWRDLIKIKNNYPDIGWIVGGDFNAVKNREERKGISGFNSRDVKELCDFIEEINLVDLPMFGSRFTWFNSKGKSKSRLDRVLVDHRVIYLFTLKNLVVGDRGISDHRPVWLKSNFINWGPKPFRTFNCWFYHKDFIPFVTKPWRSYQFTGSFCSILTKKFQALKSDLRIWNLKVFGWLDLNIEDNIYKFKKLELELDVESNQQSTDLDKEKLRWLQNGDLNTKCFHDSLKSRHRLNHLSAIVVEDRNVEEPENIKDEAIKFFKDKFTQSNSKKFRSDLALAACLDEEDKQFLETNFSTFDVTKAIFSCDGNKFPGVDGFNFKFIKSCWEIVGQDFSNCILDFFKTGFLPRMFASSFISLVPKISNPQQFEDFRPISLISCISKVISKMLACSLSKVIHKIISPSQTAFIPGRQIYDGVLLANEIEDYAKRFKMECLFFKVDFAKAYNCVGWIFLDEMLVKMGFGLNWLKWIRGSVFKSYVSILINGSPSKNFKVGRGLKPLRQN
ncbi:unnamed protein product [Lathyrus sativus]|nr:unnamed protein product [Lathyrus sativus]